MPRVKRTPSTPEPTAGRNSAAIELPYVGDDASLIVRTWFGDPDRWEATKIAVSERTTASGEIRLFEDVFELVSDPAFDGWTPEQFVELRTAATISKDYVFVLDETAQTSDSQQILAINLELPHGNPDWNEPTTGRTFRLTAQQLFDVHANLSINNIGFDEYANLADSSQGW